MTIWQSIIVGLVQGLTEFLPVSSSGHMLLFGSIFDVEISLTYELVMHLATLLAVIIVLRKDVFDLIKKPFGKDMRLLIIATIPSVLIVFAFRDLFDYSFGGSFLPYCFLITAIMLLITGFIRHTPKKQPTYFDALIIGTVQGFAAFPGISRSGSTISTSVMLGNEKQSAAKFSFLLSIPIIIGSSAVSIMEGGLVGVEIQPLIFGFVSAFVSGLFAIKFMLKFLSGSFDFFIIYLFALSIFLILNNTFLHWF